jgi:hypothetical protein
MRRSSLPEGLQVTPSILRPRARGVGDQRRPANPPARHRGPSTPEQRRQRACPPQSSEPHPPLGASLNRHVHYDENHPGFRASRALAGAQIRSRRIGHCCIIDGVFEPVEEADNGPQAVRFRAAVELTPEALTTITDQVRTRVLRWFARSGQIERDDVREMLPWQNSGVSLVASRCPLCLSEWRTAGAPAAVLSLTTQRPVCRTLLPMAAEGAMTLAELCRSELAAAMSACGRAPPAFERR